MVTTFEKLASVVQDTSVTLAEYDASKGGLRLPNTTTIDYVPYILLFKDLNTVIPFTGQPSLEGLLAFLADNINGFATIGNGSDNQNAETSTTSKLVDHEEL